MAAAALRRVLPTISRQLANRQPLPPFAGTDANTAALGNHAVKRMGARSYRTDAARREERESMIYKIARNDITLDFVLYGSFGALCYAIHLDNKHDLKKARRNNH